VKEISDSEIELQRHILRTMLYFDIFDYPLSSTEVFRFLGTNSLTEEKVVASLEELATRKIVHKFDEFYSVQPAEGNISRRVKGNAEAIRYLTIARRKAQLISKFPFVRAVLASGSLAKGYMDHNSDIDFFIVTAPGRLWIARTLLVLYKRIFLLNSHKYFCVNYFVDEDHLEIEDKNLFTATELATVIPLYGGKIYSQLLRKNSWIRERFPNFTERPTMNVPDTSTRGLKKILEAIINFIFVNQIEAYCQAVTMNRWRRLYEKKYSKADFDIAFKSKGYASKNHPQHFQRKVMELYAEKLKSFKFPDLTRIQ
jgi:predicted nucleotidyltransferase